MVGTVDQNTWVSRVLGVAISNTNAATGSGYADWRAKWGATRAALGTELGALKADILDKSKDDANYPAIAAGVSVFDGILTELDARLLDSLAAIDACADPSKRHGLMTEAQAIVVEYSNFVATDPLMRAIDGNPFAAVSVNARTTEVLRGLGKALK